MIGFPHRFNRALFFSLPMLIAPRAMAHEFWLEPSTFAPRPGSNISLRLMTGERFEGEPVPRMSAWIKRFEYDAGGTRHPVGGAEWRDPAGYVPVRGEGIRMVLFESAFSVAELEAGDFEAYLREEGLDRAIQLRERRNETGMKGIEAFARCVKLLLRADKTDGLAYSRPAGLTLEIVPLGNPLTIEPGDTLPVRVLYQGDPVANLFVKAFRKNHPGETPPTGRTGADGVVELTLPGDGVWLVNTVHMIPAPRSFTTDWLSYWSSLTFKTG